MEQSWPINADSSDRRRRLMFVGVLAVISALAVWGGVRLRQYVFEATKPIRYSGDVTHGFSWGQIGRQFGVFNVYDMYEKQSFQLFRYRYDLNPLDYTPLRLTTMTLWGHWATKNRPDATSWRNEYSLTWPILTFNMAAELVSSVLVFFIVRHWVQKRGDRRYRAELLGMLGALLFWFNPAVIMDGHGFPQWDIWLAPFFLGAVLLGLKDWWFGAGVCVVIGAFFKGQILLVAPIFLIWPVIQGRFSAPLKFAAGFALAGAILAFPWMRPGNLAMGWLMLMVAALVLTAPIALRWEMEPKWYIALGLLAMIVSWPWGSDASLLMRFVPALVVMAAACTILLPARLVPHVYALCIAATVLLLMPLYDASTAWYRFGFEFGTQKIMWMATEDTYNIPEIMKVYYRWSNNPNATTVLPWIESRISIRDLMLRLYAITLLLCSIAAAVHHRRDDPRFLVALVAPWLLWFVLLTQLNNRYLIWVSGFSALFVAVGPGMTLLGLVVSVIGWIGIAQIMCWSGGEPQLARWINPLTPHLAWALLLAAGIYLWFALTPGRGLMTQRNQRRTEAGPLVPAASILRP